MNNRDETEIYANPLWSRSAHTVRTSTDNAPNRAPYQASLRSIGAYVDERNWVALNILETADGFFLRYQSSPDPFSSRVVHLQYADLLSLTHELERKRHRGFLFGRRSQGKYEDHLRAVGFELDGIGAYSVLIDELDDKLLVTFQYLEPTEGFNARKRMVLFGPEDLTSILRDAHLRRQRGKGGLLKARAG